MIKAIATICSELKPCIADALEASFRVDTPPVLTDLPIVHTFVDVNTTTTEVRLESTAAMCLVQRTNPSNARVRACLASRPSG